MRFLNGKSLLDAGGKYKIIFKQIVNIGLKGKPDIGSSRTLKKWGGLEYIGICSTT